MIHGYMCRPHPFQLEYAMSCIALAQLLSGATNGPRGHIWPFRFQCNWIWRHWSSKAKWFPGCYGCFKCLVVSWNSIILLYYNITTQLGLPQLHLFCILQIHHLVAKRYTVAMLFEPWPSIILNTGYITTLEVQFLKINFNWSLR